MYFLWTNLLISPLGERCDLSIVLLPWMLCAIKVCLKIAQLFKRLEILIGENLTVYRQVIVSQKTSQLNLSAQVS